MLSFSEAPLGSPLSLLDFVSYEAAISDLDGPRRQPANLRTIGGSLKAKLANCIFTLLGNDSRLLQPGTSSIHYGPTRLHQSNSKLRDDDESIAWIKWAFNVDICSGGSLESGSLPTFWLLVYAKCFQVRSHMSLRLNFAYLVTASFVSDECPYSPSCSLTAFAPISLRLLQT